MWKQKHRMVTNCLSKLSHSIAATAKDKPELVNAGTFVNETTCIQKQNQISQQREQAARDRLVLVYRNQHTSQLLLCLYRLMLVGLAELALL